MSPENYLRPAFIDNICALNTTPSTDRTGSCDGIALIIIRDHLFSEESVSEIQASAESTSQLCVIHNLFIPQSDCDYLPVLSLPSLSHYLTLPTNFALEPKMGANGGLKTDRILSANVCSLRSVSLKHRH